MDSVSVFSKFKLQFAVVALLSVCGLSSCGTSNDPGLNLGVSVSPEKAYVVPGKGISCVAQASAKASDEPAIADIEGDRILFNHFKLQWRSPDAFTVAQIKVTLFGTGVSGAETTTGKETVLSEEETAALLGLTGLSIPYANPYLNSDGTPVSRVLDIESTSTSSKASTPYAPCGLQIGGLTSPVGIKTYSVKVKIEVLGYATDCSEKNKDGTCLSGIQTPVRQTVNVSAQKY
ncbi:hypothetical protein BH10BDE1_BH10BDE1_25280 [soil metagenome]